MIACDVCNDWFHGECVGMTERKAQSLKIYVCPPCTKSRAAGQRRRSVVKVREDVEVNVEDEDDDEEDQYEKENYHEYQQQRRKRAKGQPAAARGRTKGTIPGSTTTSAARRRSIGANGIGGMRRSQSIIEDDTNHVVAGETDSSKEVITLTPFQSFPPSSARAHPPLPNSCPSGRDAAQSVRQQGLQQRGQASVQVLQHGVWRAGRYAIPRNAEGRSGGSCRARAYAFAQALAQAVRRLAPLE